METLNAEPTLIRLGVHELAAFVFCRRAGLIAFEKKHEDDGNDAGLARLDFKHAYEFIELHEQLKHVLNWMVASSVVMGLSLICLWVSTSPLLFVGITLLELYLLKYFLKSARNVFQYSRSIRAYEVLPGKSPDPTSTNDEAINWWSMRSAGFEAILPPAPFHDEENNLIGKPWRLLRHGSTLIPVFRANKAKNIKEQHRVRIAAYCQLVEQCEGSYAPYGIVLDPIGYAGTAIKITESLQHQLREELRRARQTISQARASAKQEPSPPRNEEKCKLCPYGKVHASDDQLHLNVRGEPSEVYGLESPSGKTFHSNCGDRFHWRPPHKTLLEQGWSIE